MPLLRIDQQPGAGPGQFRIAVSAEIPGLQPLGYSRDIAFALTPQEAENIRWYLEDYLQFDQEPAPTIARRIEKQMTDCGERLFAALFDGNSQASRLWALLQPHLPATRIAVTTGIAEATAIPWELLRDAHSRTNLALSAAAFVRSQADAQPALAAPQAAEQVRILLVICRPLGGADVPFRSVASRFVASLEASDRAAYRLDVLRPPTFAQLARVLREAGEREQPYHIVHFDGHGTYAEAKNLQGVGPALSAVMLKGEASGPRGYLVFEDPGAPSRRRYVDGFTLGALLRDTGVPILILNACQSAFAEAPPKPAEDAGAATSRDEVEAYGALAQAVMQQGAAGVVAMRYAVYAVTAAHFIAELYAALARGRSLGEAAASARKALASQPERCIAEAPRALQDWVVPVVWEPAPLRLWPQRPGAAPRGGSAPVFKRDARLPEPPDVGFFGRDETLYGLDRAFDTQPIVLLQAYAGSGKTSVAAEFARWYQTTGGVQGPVLFSSFEHHLPLARLLDTIGLIFDDLLQANGIAWDALTDTGQRRDIALRILQQIPVLWIWDNVEPVAGFPAGTPSAWSHDEQQELRAFLSAARTTKAKFLLTSRRDEAAWLGDLPRRVAVPPMPMQERRQLAAAILDKRGRRLADLPDLTELLRFTQGNPLTILVTLGAALRAGIDTPARLDAFLASLRRGEADLHDEVTEGRSASLGASLSYGFAQAFDEDERRILALLHLFQGFVDVRVLCTMGHPAVDGGLEAVRGLTRERGMALLDRAAELGLLVSHGGGYYGIHPALPWYFRDLFERQHPAEAGDAARRAFVATMGALGNFYHDRYGNGDRAVMAAMAAEEANWLAAWRLARAQDWWDAVTSTMQGLRNLYVDNGRQAAWQALVAAIVPDCIDPADDGPRPGREDQWSLVTGYRVGILRTNRHWQEAERLQRLRVAWNRKRAQAALQLAPEARDGAQRHDIRTLAVSLQGLANIQLEQGDPACVAAYREAFDLAGAIEDQAAQSVCAHSLGVAYHSLAAIQDFDTAESWLRTGLELSPEDDPLGRGRSLGQIGTLLYQRFIAACGAGCPAAECRDFLTKAAASFEEALAVLPATATRERGIMHNQLGILYRTVGATDAALQHFRQDIRYCEQANDFFGAGQTRFNAACALLDAGRCGEAHLYAEAALANYQSFGPRAAAEIQEVESLIAAIDAAAAQQKGAS